MAARGAMQQVELVEPTPDDGAARAGTGPGGAWWTRWRRVPGWVWLAAVAVVIALVSVQVGIDAHERAADARLGRIAGAVAPLHGPPHGAWTIQGPDAQLLRQGLVAGDVALGVRPDPDGSRHVDAIGLSDGRLRWSATLDGPDPVRARTDAPFADAACRLVVGAVPAQVACVTTDQVATFSDGLLYVTRPATRGHLVVLDAATGRRVVDRATAATPAFVVLPGLVVLAQAGRDGHTHLTAQALAHATPRWTYVSPSTVPEAVGEPLLQLAAVGRHAFVLVDGSGGATVLDASGHVLSGPSGPLAAWSAPAGSGAALLVAGAHVGSGDGVISTTLVRPGLPDVQVSGRVAVPVADDGSLSGLVVTVGRGGVRGFDAASGRLRWTVPVTPAGNEAVVLGGTVVLGTYHGLVGIDGRDGHVRWKVTTAPEVEVTDLRSDGRYVLAVEATTTGADLAAYTPGSGRLVWTSAVASGDVRPVGRALVAFIGDTATRVAS
jgi:outer membrane protein assembly factor BamB